VFLCSLLGFVERRWGQDSKASLRRNVSWYGEEFLLLGAKPVAIGFLRLAGTRDHALGKRDWMAHDIGEAGAEIAGYLAAQLGGLARELSRT
jgi:hypothetical protein